jgi:hypothetical protein
MDTTMQSVNSAHLITAGFGSTVQVATGPGVLTDFSTPTSNATVLGRASNARAFLLVADVNVPLEGGIRAAGRRVKTPGGCVLFSMYALTSDGKKILARSLAWAAAPVQVTNVRVTIQTTPGATREAIVPLLNRPQAPVR